jgi:hypothetical protein
VTDLILVFFPCGCVVDAGSSSTDAEQTLAECKWCGAVFLTGELREWFKGAAPSIWLERAPALLARDGERVVEFAGLCGCGTPLGREFGQVGKFHLGEEAVPARN